MTAELMKIENRAVSTGAEMFGESLIERFAEFAGVSESSRRTYVKSLRQMFKYFAANSITMPTRQNLKDWFDAMKIAGDDGGKKVTLKMRLDKECVIRRTGDVTDGGGVYVIREDVLYLTTEKSEVVISTPKSNSTVMLYLASAKVFFRWLAQENIYPNIADHLKAAGVKPSHDHKKDALSAEQCKELVANVKGNSVKELRDKAILMLMATTGVRTIEVVRANIDNIRFEFGKVFLRVTGKGHTEDDEKVLLSRQTHKAISEYLKARGKTNATDPLFVSTSRRNKNARLKTQAISRMVKRNLREIGLDSPRLTAHSLRHTVATILIHAHVKPEKVQMVMRHKSYATTLIYVEKFKRFNNDSEQFLSDKIFGKFKE